LSVATSRAKSLGESRSEARRPQRDLNPSRDGGDEHGRAISATSGTASSVDEHEGPSRARGMGRESGPPLDPTADPVELGLVKLMQRAADVGQWDVVRELAAQLEARRKARTGVVDLVAERSRRTKS
jgi:hypothetical protein